MDIKLTCHACEQHVLVDSSAAGSTVNCPGCGTGLIVPQVVAPPPLPPAYQPYSQPAAPSSAAYVAAPPPKQRTIAWGVFWGLFGFFIILPICVIAIIALLAGVGKVIQDHDRQVTGRPTASDIQNVTIGKNWSWNLLKATDGYLIHITYPLQNETKYKLTDLKLTVRFYDANARKIFEAPRSQLADMGMDFAPPNRTTECEMLITLTNITPSSVKKVSLAIDDFRCRAMTALDTRLWDLWKIGNDFENSGREKMTPEEDAADKEFDRLLKQKLNQQRPN
jgi:hypothetical protein